MKRLTIDNIGPVRHVELDLRKINVIIGPQSSGKSCILKLACFCAWAEKRIQLQQGKNGFSDPDYLEQNLIDYHKLNGYFVKGRGARFEYSSDTLWLKYAYDEKAFSWGWKPKGRWTYKRKRISYIPAERNIIAAIPNWMEVSLKDNYIRNFISDWMLTRTFYNKDNKLQFPDLGAKYYYDKNSGQDLIELENGDLLRLTNSSSGVQSALPMIVYLGFLFENQYKKGQFAKISSQSENEKIASIIYDKKFKPLIKDVPKEKLFPGAIEFSMKPFHTLKQYKECLELISNYQTTSGSDIYLEEPELSLFPSTQVKILYDILVNRKPHDDSIFIATHSPYILYALNNAMLAYYVKEKILEEVKSVVSCLHAATNPEEVAVWQVEDGKLQGLSPENPTIQDNRHLIRKNYFDNVMGDVIKDFNNMLNFYEPESY